MLRPRFECWFSMTLLPGSVRAAAGQSAGSAKGGLPVPRRHFVTTRNAFEHIGAVSSLRQTGLSHTPGCGASLTAFLWNMERFRNTQRCGEIGIVPCVKER